jgi:hypothetical protein
MPDRPRFDTDAVRALVRQRVAASSLREVAEEIGITRGGLESFLKGRDPYSKNRLRLAAWRLRQQQAGDGVRRQDVDAALALIEQYINSAGTKAGRARRVREVTARLASSSS